MEEECRKRRREDITSYAHEIRDEATRTNGAGGEENASVGEAQPSSVGIEHPCLLQLAKRSQLQTAVCHPLWPDTETLAIGWRYCREQRMASKADSWESKALSHQVPPLLPV
ncbi:uncharacterized protein WM294_002516 isoform 2-T6 [Sarcoramphus papa]